MKKESGNQKFNIKFDIAVNIVMGIIYILTGSCFITILNPFSISNIEGEGKTILYVISITAVLVVFYGIKKIIDAFTIKNELMNTKYDKYKVNELSEQIEKRENKFLKKYIIIFLSGILSAIMIFLINMIKAVGLFNLQVLSIVILLVIPIIIILYNIIKK